MFKIDNWEIGLSTGFEPPVTLFENTNKVIAIQNNNVIAVLWKIPNGVPRIDAHNVSIAISEKDHVIHLGPTMTLDEIIEREAELLKISNT